MQLYKETISEILKQNFIKVYYYLGTEFIYWNRKVIIGLQKR